MKKLKYKRVLLKLSGEAFKGRGDFGFDKSAIERLVEEILSMHTEGVEVGVVAGAGNIFRGGASFVPQLHRAVADYIGMTATVINALILRSFLITHGVDAYVMSALESGRVVDSYRRTRAIDLLKDGAIMIYAGGTGNPYFTTDTAAVLRAVETDAEVVIKATNVRGVYSDDPNKNPDAKFFSTLTFDEVIEKNLKVMDATAFTMARDNAIPIIVCNIWESGNLRRIVTGESVGSIISK